MNGFESVTIREVESSDLETFYEHQLDPEAIRMAAFVGKTPDGVAWWRSAKQTGYGFHPRFVGDVDAIFAKV